MMTEKEFLDVFPQLKVDPELESLLGEVKVMKVAINPQKDCLRVYVLSRQWIHKKHIYHLEAAIKEQFFANAPLQVKIIEKFQLSSQYTPENFLDVYRQSILLELKQYSALEYNMFYTAQITFSDPETMNLVMNDSVIARDREHELVRVLEKIFCERCGFNLKVHPAYRKPVESKSRKNSELRIQEEARQILLHSKVGNKNRDRDAEEDLSGQGVEAPFAEDRVIGADGKEQKPQGKAPQKTGADGGKQPAGKGKDANKGGFRDRNGGRNSGRGNFQKGRYGDGPRPLKRSDNPDVIYGRDFDDDAITIDSIAGEMGEITIRGQVTSVEAREIRNEKTIYMFNITDFTDTITVKMFLHNEQVPEISGAIKKGAFLKLKGVTTIDKFDHEITIGSLAGIKKISDFTTSRMDNSPEKRVELHCHTKMSDMDGVSEVKSIIKRAKKWGMSSIAVTDHGCVQAFPDANHALDKGDTFKILYGVEGYLVDDTKQLVENSKGQTFADTYVVFDIETTGFSPVKTGSLRSVL